MKVWLARFTCSIRGSRDPDDESGRVQWTNLIRSKVIGHGETRQGYKMTSSFSKEIGIYEMDVYIYIYIYRVIYCESSAKLATWLMRSVVCFAYLARYIVAMFIETRTKR